MSECRPALLKTSGRVNRWLYRWMVSTRMLHQTRGRVGLTRCTDSPPPKSAAKLLLRRRPLPPGSYDMNVRVPTSSSCKPIARSEGLDSEARIRKCVSLSSLAGVAAFLFQALAKLPQLRVGSDLSACPTDSFRTGLQCPRGRTSSVSMPFQAISQTGHCF